MKLNSLNIYLNFFITSVISVKKGLNILIHSSEGSRSHIKPILEISEILLQRGHDISYVAMEDKLRYAKEYNVSQYSIGKPPMEQIDLRSHFRRILDPKRSTSHSGLMLEVLQGLFLASYDDVFKGLENYLLSNKPDLMICDFAAGACSDLAQKYAIPLIIGLQTTDVFDLVPMPYITKTMAHAPLTTESLSLIDRFYYQIAEPIFALRFMYPIKKIMDYKKASYRIPAKPTVMGDFNYGLGLANTYVGFEPAMPMPPNIKLVGPILSKNRVYLDESLKEFLDNHSKTIYIGFGTNVVLSKDESETILKTVLSALNNKLIDGAIWGLTNTWIEDLPSSINLDGVNIKKKDILKNPNLKLLPWTPQQSILEHKNTVLHITHGGLESVIESLSSTTPMLVIPFLGDQPRNAAKIQMMGVGDYINRLKMDVPSLLEKIKILSDSQNQNMKSNLLKMQLLTQLGSRRVYQAADTIEEHAYLAQLCRQYHPYDPSHPPCEMAHLLPASTRMPWYQSSMLDIYLSMGLLIIIGVLFIQYLINFISRMVSRLNRNSLHVSKKLN